MAILRSTRVSVSERRRYERAKGERQRIARLGVRPVTGTQSTNVINLTGHGFVLDQRVVFSGLVGGAGLTNGTVYFARTTTANTFQVSATAGGAAIDFTTDLTAGLVRPG